MPKQYPVPEYPKFTQRYLIDRINAYHVIYINPVTFETHYKFPDDHMRKKEILYMLYLYGFTPRPQDHMLSQFEYIVKQTLEKAKESLPYS